MRARCTGPGPQLIAHASRDTSLRPGDVLGSGTVGTGCILELTPEAVGGWLKPGDVVALTIEHLGTLRNTVGAASGNERFSMPPLSQARLRSPQTAHRPSPRAGISAARESPTKKSSQPPASAGPTASFITSGRRRGSRRIEPAGTRRRWSSPLSPSSGIITSRPGRCGAGRPDDAAVSRSWSTTTSCSAAAARPSRRPSCTAMPTADEVLFVHRAAGRCTRCSARCPSAPSTTW